MCFDGDLRLRRIGWILAAEPIHPPPAGEWWQGRRRYGKGATGGRGNGWGMVEGMMG